MDCLPSHNSQTHTNTMQMPTTMASAAAPHEHLPMELRPPYYLTKPGIGTGIIRSYSRTY
jgi:hypothetical protein